MRLEPSPVDVRDASEIERAVTAFALRQCRPDRDGERGGDASSRSNHCAGGSTPIARGYASRYFVIAGGLMSYGPDLIDQYRRAAGYVDRIGRNETISLPAVIPRETEINCAPMSVSAMCNECVEIDENIRASLRGYRTHDRAGPETH